MLGSVAVAAFSLSLPATRAAVAGGIPPLLVAFGRAAIAGLLATGYLLAVRAPRPDRATWRRLAVVAAGVVFGFPVLTSLALESEGAAHGGVVIAVLPAATAVLAVLRGRERPSVAFWLASAAGSACVLAFAVTSGSLGSWSGLSRADVMLLLAVVLCAAGYAEGGLLARTLGGARTISWALVLALPLNLVFSALVLAGHGGVPAAGPAAWLGFGYVSLVAMYLGFFAWYAALAHGGVARVGQVQLAQPVLTLVAAALLLDEHVGVTTALAALAVLACVAITQRVR
ncbi:MAG TPA: DMT family transporter [Pseudonocardiaceae bacterium]